MQMLVSRIIVEERRRDGVGDITELAANIRAHGLLHPIVVTAGGVLVAGERRLRAHEHLGRKHIDVTQLGDVSADQLREIELSENIHRLDLTRAERNKVMAQKIERARAAAAVDAVSVQLGPKLEGRPPKPASERDLARRTSTPKTTVHRATAYAAATEAYPVLDGWPKTPAIEAAKLLTTIPGDRRADVIAQVAQGKLMGKPALDFIRSSIRGRITTINPGAGTNRPAENNAEPTRKAEMKDGMRLAALKDAHKFVILAAREFDDDRGTRLREMATEIQAMLGAL